MTSFTCADVPSRWESRKVRVAFVIPALCRGGTERQLLYLIQGLDRSLFDPTLVLFEAAERVYDCGDLSGSIKLLRIPAAGNFRARRAPALQAAVVLNS